MLGAWCLLKGLDRLLSLTPSGIFEKTREVTLKPKPIEKSAESSAKSKDSAPGSSRPGSWKGYACVAFFLRLVHCTKSILASELALWIVE